jgi:Domain of unknown function (DUF4282)
MSYDPGSPGDRSQQPAGQGWPGGQQYPGGYGQQQPPPSPGWGSQGPAGAGPTQVTPGDRSGFAAMFDFSFSSFATPSLIRLMYIVGSVLIGLFYIGYVIALFSVSPALGLITVVVGAVVALFSMAMLRMSLEFYYAVVRMSEDIRNGRR